MGISVNKQAVYEAAEKLRNWGRWGRDDQIGTLNHATPEDVIAAAALIKRGQSFALGIPLDRRRNGPGDRDPGRSAADIEAQGARSRRVLKSERAWFARCPRPESTSVCQHHPYP